MALRWEQPKKPLHESAWEKAFREDFSPAGLAALDPSPETVRALCEAERWAVWETSKKIDPDKPGANMPHDFGTVPERYGVRAVQALERAMAAINDHADAVAGNDEAAAAYERAIWIFKLMTGANKQAAGFQPDGDPGKGGPKIIALVGQIAQLCSLPEKDALEDDLAEAATFLKAYDTGRGIYWNEQMKPDMADAAKNPQISTAKLYHMSHDHNAQEEQAGAYARRLVEGNIKGRLNWLSQVMAHSGDPAPQRSDQIRFRLG